jgi:hypothetical protein
VQREEATAHRWPQTCPRISVVNASPQRQIWSRYRGADGRQIGRVYSGIRDLLPCRNRYIRLHEHATLLSVRGSTDEHRDLAFAPRRSSVRTLPRAERPRRYRPCWRPGPVRELPARGLRPPQPRSTRSRLLPGVPKGATSGLQTLPARDGTVRANPKELRRVRSPTPRCATPAQALLLDTLPCPGTPRTAGYVTHQRLPVPGTACNPALWRAGRSPHPDRPNGPIYFW